MQELSHQKRIKNIYQMLFEMATGNLYFRINIQSEEEEILEIERKLNSLAFTMQENFSKLGYVTPYYHYQNLVQFTLELDKEANIQNFSQAVIEITGHATDDLITLPFSEILAPQSKEIWNQIKKEADTAGLGYHTTAQLIFRTKENLFTSHYCTITQHLYSNKIIIASVTTILEDIMIGIELMQPIKSRKIETDIIQSVFEYIMEHLEEPLPSAKELAAFFGTNEFKLKEGFRHCYHTSIYQFYNNERLKKAHYLIQKTDFPLKEIPFMSGFNDYANFSKAFKKKYSYSPSDLKRDI